MDYQFIAT